MEEEWSIISSSSEMEEDRSSNSSMGDTEETPLLDRMVEHLVDASDTTDQSDDHADPEGSVGTLKLPNIRSIPGSMIKEHPLDDIEEVEHHELKGISKIIEFYENFSANTLKLHQSIKHQSDLMYQQLTRSTTDIPDKEVEDDATQASKVEQVTLYNNYVNHCKGLKTKVNRFVGDNSEYLIYFVMATILASYSTVKLFQYWTAVVEPEPSFVDNFMSSLDSILFEQVDNKQWFGKVKKTKQIRFGTQFNALYQKLSSGDYIFLLRNSLKQYYHLGMIQTENIWNNVVNTFSHVSKNKYVGQSLDISKQIIGKSQILTSRLISNMKPVLQSTAEDIFELSQLLYDKSYWYGVQGLERVRFFTKEGYKVIKAWDLPNWNSTQMIKDVKGLQMMKQMSATYNATKHMLIEHFS